MHGKYNKVVVIIRWRSSRSINRCNTEKKSREWQNPMALNTLTKRLWRNHTDFFFSSFLIHQKGCEITFFGLRADCDNYFSSFEIGSAAAYAENNFFSFAKFAGNFCKDFFFLCFRRFLGEVLCLWRVDTKTKFRPQLSGLRTNSNNRFVSNFLQQIFSFFCF